MVHFDLGSTRLLHRRGGGGGNVTVPFLNDIVIGQDYIEQVTISDPDPLGAVAYWRLEESGAATRPDITGRGNDLGASGSPPSAAGIIDNALDSSSGNFLTRASTADLTSGDVALTIAGWVWFDEIVGQHDILGKYSAGALEYIVFKFAETTGFGAAFDNRLTFGVSDNGTVFTGQIKSSFSPIVINTWYFVIVWHDPDANTLNIQVNDGTVDSLAWTTGILAGTSPFRIGGNPDQFPHDGRADEVGVWKRILTAAERTFVYNSGAGRAFGTVTPRCLVTPTIDESIEIAASPIIAPTIDLTEIVELSASLAISPLIDLLTAGITVPPSLAASVDVTLDYAVSGTVPTGISGKSATCECWGGGGGGGTIFGANPGGGGGGGGYGTKVVTISAGNTVTVGAGGPVGTGGDSSFVQSAATVAGLGGGAGGAGTSSGPGIGGAGGGGVGTTTHTGGTGGDGVILPSGGGGGGGAGSSTNGDNAGTAPFPGAGGTLNFSAVNTAGGGSGGIGATVTGRSDPGVRSGGGGGGASGANSASAGAAGRVRITFAL